MGRRFGSASVQYGDWHGTVSLDDPDESGELERIAGVDPNDWRIWAIDISGASGTGIRASVLAVRHELIEDFGDWERVARDNDGAIPVTEFELREGTASPCWEHSSDRTSGHRCERRSRMLILSWRSSKRSSHRRPCLSRRLRAW